MTGPDGEGRGAGTGAPDSSAVGSRAYITRAGTGHNGSEVNHGSSSHHADGPKPLIGSNMVPDLDGPGAGTNGLGSGTEAPVRHAGDGRPSACSGMKPSEVCSMNVESASARSGKTKPLPPALHHKPARRGQQLPAPCDIDALQTDQLLDWVERLYGVAPDARMSRELLLRAVAHGLQLHQQGRKGIAAARAMAGASVRSGRTRGAARNGGSGNDWGSDNESRRASADAVGKHGNKDGDKLSEHSGKRGNDQSLYVSPTRHARSLPPGSRLVREWHGAIHEVIVQSDGSYLWQGRAWKSLSVIARTITGVNWSGPRFFGTAARKAGSHSTGDGEAFQSVKHPGGGNDA